MTRDEIQEKAVEKWLEFDKKGTLNLITGLGKTFCSLHALYTMPKDDGKTHLFLAEQVDRQTDLIKDIVKYNEMFDRNVLQDYHLQFQCYQTVCKWKDKSFGLVIADEIHDSLTPVYSQFYLNNTYDAILGLSATINRDIEYTIDDKVVTKGNLLDAFAPACFVYTVNQGQINNTSRKLNLYIVNHELEKVEKTVKAGSKFKPFLQTEEKAYEYWDNQFKKLLFSEPKENEDFFEFEKIKNLKILVSSNKRKSLLYTLESKNKAVKLLLNVINGKSIVFANSIDSLLKITKNTVSSRNSKDANELIRSNFDKNKIKVIGSFKKLQQGANLSDLDNVILHSYYSVEGKFIQMLGRARLNGDKVGSVFIFKTKNTQEEKWLNKAIENFNEYNIIDCIDLKDCIVKYTKNTESDE